jgi:hypothetical protein
LLWCLVATPPPPTPIIYMSIGITIEQDDLLSMNGKPGKRSAE